MKRCVPGLVAASLAILVGVVLFHTSSTFAAPATHAATPVSSRGGVTISPAFQQISLAADKPSVTYDFGITNNTPDEQEFALSVADFGSLDETGGVLFAGNGQKTLNYRYYLSPWVTMEKDRIVVAPYATEKVPITIENKESLAPGGHYGAVLVTPTDSGTGTAKKVQIDQVVSSLLFVKKLGGEVYHLSLNKFAVRTHIFSLPGTAELRFQNSGNVHVIPRGVILVSDPRGRVVKRGIINADSGIVLPESFRQLSVPLQSVGTSLLPGRYTVTTSYRYDDVPTSKTMTTSFLYLNALFVALLAVVVILLLLLGVVPALRRRLTATCKQLWMRVAKLLPGHRDR